MVHASSRGERVPLFAPWARGYTRSWIRFDVLAGLSAAAVVIPQALAYATIAGLPVQVGLYCALVPMVVYGLLGSSRTLSVSTTSTLSILTAEAIATAGSGNDPLTVASTLAVTAGVLLVVAGVMRLGFLADFISRPVLVGFKVGMGITIAVGQLGNILGVPVTGDGVFRKLGSAFSQLPDASVETVAVAAVTVITLIVLRRVAPRVPGPLVVLIGGIVAVAVFGLGGVATVATVPTGLPLPTMPDFSLVWHLLPSAAGVALMAFTESISAARTFRAKHDPPVDADRELLALGAASLAGGFFRAYPSGGGLSQTAVNSGSGARSQAAGLATAVVVALTLLVLAPAFSDLPLAVLGGIVLMVALGLAELSGLHDLRSFRLAEFRLALVAAVGVLLLGVLNGILVAVLISLLVLLWELNHPPIVILGRDPRSGAYRRITGDGDLASTPGLLIVRVESRLFFANARRVMARLRDVVVSGDPLPAVVVLDASAITDIDVTAADAFEQLRDDLAARGIDLWVARLEGRTLDLEMRRPRWADDHQGRVYPTLDAAVEAFQSRS